MPRKGIYVDTCSALYSMEDKQAMQIIEMYGEDRILFGTDYPMWSYHGEFERLKALPLRDETREKFIGKMPQGFLKLNFKQLLQSGRITFTAAEHAKSYRTSKIR